MNHEEESQTLIDHLTELRVRLIRSFLFIGAGFAGCWAFSETLFDIMRQPIMPFLSTDSGGLIFTAPMDKFLAHVKVSLLGGIIVTTPFWIYQLWKFVAPGLYEKERKYAVGFITFGTLLFLSGVAFVYYLVYPMAFEFLMTFGGKVDQPMITISDYLSFFTTTTLVFGVAFEMPMILTLLGMGGVIDHHFLVEKRRYAIIALAAISAIITPPDIISMGMMMVPMVLLYEASVILVRIFGHKPA